MTYEYNKLGQKTRVLYQNGSTLSDVRYVYYANGWLKRVKNGTDPVSKYTYDAVGNRTRTDLGNTDYTTYGYDTDPRYRVAAIKHYDSSDALLASPGILYASRDGAGNPLSMQDWNGTAAYAYDMYSRLGSILDYDQVGNRYAGTWSYNAVDQLIATGSNKYDYLMTGSLANQLNAAGTLVEKSYSYSYANLLTGVTNYEQGIPTSNSSMAWDGDSNRISFTSSQSGVGTTQFVYDTTAGIPAVIEEVLPSTQSVYYIREPNGSLVARMAGTTGANIRYYHFDALGSTKLLTDSTGAVTDKYTYDAWGALTNHEQLTGSVDQPYQYVGRLGYYTHYQDANLNNANLSLLQLGVRFYDPALGRFMQVDPVGGVMGTYGYCGLQPTAAADPNGLAYMKFNGKQLCLYHDDGRVWLCCSAESGPGSASKDPPIQCGKYRVDPSDVTVNGFCMQTCARPSWGCYRCNIRDQNGNRTHKYIHGGEAGRGTGGCVRIPDCRYSYDPEPGFQRPILEPVDNSCLERLMKLLKEIGTPIGLIVE